VLKARRLSRPTPCAASDCVENPSPGIVAGLKPAGFSGVRGPRAWPVEEESRGTVGKPGGEAGTNNPA